MKCASSGLMVCTLIVFGGCVEDFVFDVSQERKVLIVDGYISNISYNNSANYAIDNKYFDVYLKFSSGVKNNQDEPVSGAEVQVVSDANESWDYSEVSSGLYRLYFEDFNAELNKKYKIQIILQNGDRYESTFETLPMAQEMADVFFKEEEVVDYKYLAGDIGIRTLKGIKLYAAASSLGDLSGMANYKWDFSTTYGAIAWGLRPEELNYKCWITSPLFYKDRVVVQDNGKGLSHELFFLETNSQYIHEGFSVSFRQMVLSDQYYQFWVDLGNQEKQEDLFAPPPYNIISNLSAVGHENPVYGYFGVVSENFHRWYFSKEEISYYIDYPEELQRCGSPPGPECFDCRLIGRAIRSTISNTEPTWWKNEND